MVDTRTLLTHLMTPDAAGDIGVAVWIALRRVHQGGVTNLTGRWRDRGSPVPGPSPELVMALVLHRAPGGPLPVGVLTTPGGS